MEKNWKSALVKGLKGRCPRCGQSSLFKAYLKPVDQCSSCQFPWKDIRADDGPAWATILVVGHFLAPLFHILIFQNELPVWITTTLLVTAAIILSLLFLPRVKGAFMAMIWATDAPTS